MTSPPERPAAARVLGASFSSPADTRRAPLWTLLAGLSRDGFDTRLLRPAAIAHGAESQLEIEHLPISPQDSWSLRWLALIRSIEELAPCSVLMFDDPWVEAVTPRLSSRARVVGVVDADAEHAYRRAARLGSHWNTVVATTDAIHFNLLHRVPRLAGRVVTLTQRDDAEEPAAAYAALLREIDATESGDPLVRIRGGVVEPTVPPPPEQPRCDSDDAARVDSTPLWPNAPRGACPERGPSRPTSAPTRSSRLSEHRLFVSASQGEISGVDVFSRTLVEQLRGRGLDASLLITTVTDDGPLMPTESVPVVESPSRGLYAPWYQWQALLSFLADNAPCVYLPNYDYSLAAIVPALPEAVKVMTIAHSDDPAYYDLVGRVGASSNVVVAVSHAIASQIAELTPWVQSRLHVIPYGVEVPSPPERVISGSAPLRILFAGRLVSYQKRVLDLVPIADRLIELGVEFELWVAGDGAERDLLGRRAEHLVEQRRLRFLGALPHQQLMEVMTQADALIMTSAFEGLPLTVLEAMCHQVVPVVAAVRSGVPELVRHGENGFVVPVADHQAFASQLARLAREPDVRRSLAASARRTIESGDYTVEHMTGHYVDLLESITQPGAITRGRPLAPPEHLLHQLRLRTRAYWRARASIRSVRNHLRGAGTR